MTPNRIVAALTPLFAVAAGGAASWLAEKGLDVSEDNLQAIFIAGAVTVLAPALHWLHGWQKWEIRQEDAIVAASQGFPAEAPTIAAPTAEEAPDDGFDLALDDDYDEYDDLLDADEFEDTSFAEDEEPVAAGS